MLGTVQERSNLYPALRELTLRKKMTARTQTSMHQSMPKSKVRHGGFIPVIPVLGKFKVKFRYVEWEVSQFKTQSQPDRIEQQQKHTTPKTMCILENGKPEITDRYVHMVEVWAR